MDLLTEEMKREAIEKEFNKDQVLKQSYEEMLETLAQKEGEIAELKERLITITKMEIVEPIAREFKCSIELTKAAKGNYHWNIKARGDDDAETAERIAKLNQIMEEKFNQKS